MAIVIAKHKVRDYATWLPGYIGDKARREGMGITDVAVGEATEEPGMAHMVWDVADPAAMMAMMSNPALQQMMAEAGVISAPEVVVLK